MSNNNVINYDYFGNTTLRIAKFAQNIEGQLIAFKELTEEYPELEWTDKEGQLQEKYTQALVKKGLFDSKDEKDRSRARQKSAPLENLQLINRKNKKVLPKGKILLNLLADEKSAKTINNFLQIDNLALYFLSLHFSYIKHNGHKDLLISYLAIFREFDNILSKHQFSLLPLINHYRDDEFINILRETESLKDIWNVVRKLTKRVYSDINDDDINFGTGDGQDKATIREMFSDYCLSLNITDGNLNDLMPFIEDSVLKKKVINTIKKIENIDYASRRSRYDDLFIDINKFIKDEKIKTKKDAFLFLKSFDVLHNLTVEYNDQNKRHLKLTDCFDFSSDDCITLTDNFGLMVSHPDSSFIQKHLTNINNFNSDSLDDLLHDEFIEKRLEKIGIKTPKELSSRAKDIKLRKFEKLLKNEFTEEKIFNEILPLFKSHGDNKNEIWKTVYHDAEIHTLFEYIIAITWCYITNDNTNIFHANLSLDIDMLPKSHATGGNADYVRNYDDHTLLIEPTLTKDDTQRQNEHESVSRHLGNAIVDKNENQRRLSYAIFVAPYLDMNMLRSIRNWKFRGFIKVKDKKKIDLLLNILPLNIDDIINIHKSKIDYKTFHSKFIKILNHSEEDGIKWYESCVRTLINNL